MSSGATLSGTTDMLVGVVGIFKISILYRVTIFRFANTGTHVDSLVLLNIY